MENKLKSCVSKFKESFSGGISNFVPPLENNMWGVALYPEARST